MITKETIDKIFSAIRVEEIIGEYVQLKRTGSNYKGLSPFVVSWFLQVSKFGKIFLLEREEQPLLF